MMTLNSDNDTFQERDSDRVYLCQEFIQTLSVALICLGWAWGVVLIAVGISPLKPLHWVPPFALILSGVLSNRWHERCLAGATVSALLGASLAFASATYSSQSLLFLFGFAFVALVAGVVSTPFVIVLISACPLGYILLVPGAWEQAQILRTALLLSSAGALGLSWMLWHYIYVALELSWKSRQHAIQEMRKARQRRAELHRALKALDEGYDRLRRLNQELVETRREAEDARRLKAEFAANISHELRTPINLIVGFSEMMYSSPESYGGQFLPAAYLEDAHAIYRSSRHLQSLIDDILDLSQIDANKMALTREMTSIQYGTLEAVQIIREAVERKGLNLQVEIKEDIPPIYLDRTRIRQVLLNLISNAVRFTDHGYIRVSCTMHRQGESPCNDGPIRDTQTARGIALPDEAYVCLSVSDSGIGIGQEDMDKVFEEFRQVDGSPRRKHGGTGLGLAVSKRFVELHGGWMWVESEPGTGSTFSFVLPAADDPWVSSGLKSTGDLAQQAMGNPIIVMDDDPGMVQLFRRYMRNRRVEGASTPEKAMQLTATLGPGLIVVTNSTRAENVLAWQDAYPSLTDAELSILAYPIPSEHRKALALGLSDYLVKPISREQLCDGIARLGRPIHTVLAVEDDSDMMRLLERMLSAAGHDVELHKAYSAEEAQVFLASQMPDLVLLDLALPGMSGYDFWSWMQKDASLLDVPVIVITANVHLEAAESDNTETMTLIRRSGFSPQELLAFAEMVAEKLPSRYTMTTESSRAPTS